MQRLWLDSRWWTVAEPSCWLGSFRAPTCYTIYMASHTVLYPTNARQRSWCCLTWRWQIMDKPFVMCGQLSGTQLHNSPDEIFCTCHATLETSWLHTQLIVRWKAAADAAIADDDIQLWNSWPDAKLCKCNARTYVAARVAADEIKGCCWYCCCYCLQIAA